MDLINQIIDLQQVLDRERVEGLNQQQNQQQPSQIYAQINLDRNNLNQQQQQQQSGSNVNHQQQQIQHQPNFAGLLPPHQQQQQQQSQPTQQQTQAQVQQQMQMHQVQQYQQQQQQQQQQAQYQQFQQQQQQAHQQAQAQLQRQQFQSYPSAVATPSTPRQPPFQTQAQNIATPILAPVPIPAAHIPIVVAQVPIGPVTPVVPAYEVPARRSGRERKKRVDSAYTQTGFFDSDNEDNGDLMEDYVIERKPPAVKKEKEKEKEKAIPIPKPAKPIPSNSNINPSLPTPYKSLNPTLSPWTETQDLELTNLVQTEPPLSFKSISEKLNIAGVVGEECKNRWGWLKEGMDREERIKNGNPNASDLQVNEEDESEPESQEDEEEDHEGEEGESFQDDVDAAGSSDDESGLPSSARASTSNAKRPRSSSTTNGGANLPNLLTPSLAANPPVPFLPKSIIRGRRTQSPTALAGTLFSPNGKKKKVHTCPVDTCGAAFKRSEHLKRHYRAVHDGSKPYPCEWADCGKSFSRKDNLQQHMAMVHGQQPAEKLAKVLANLAGGPVDGDLIDGLELPNDNNLTPNVKGGPKKPKVKALPKKKPTPAAAAAKKRKLQEKQERQEEQQSESEEEDELDDDLNGGRIGRGDSDDEDGDYEDEDLSAPITTSGPGGSVVGMGGSLRRSHLNGSNSNNSTPSKVTRNGNHSVGNIGSNLIVGNGSNSMTGIEVLGNSEASGSGTLNGSARILPIASTSSSTIGDLLQQQQQPSIPVTSDNIASGSNILVNTVADVNASELDILFGLGVASTSSTSNSIATTSSAAPPLASISSTSVLDLSVSSSSTGATGEDQAPADKRRKISFGETSNTSSYGRNLAMEEQRRKDLEIKIVGDEGRSYERTQI